MQYVVDASAVLPRQDAITQYVIYDHPRDFPLYFVVRPWDIARGKVEPRAIAALFADLEAARTWCRDRGCVCLGRHDGDDAKVIEVWM